MEKKLKTFNLYLLLALRKKYLARSYCVYEYIEVDPSFRQGTWVKAERVM
jgi:hypothetical protein